MDNPFVIPTEGQADWDSALDANFTALERGYHLTERAGTDISTGQCLDLNSGGFFFPNTGGIAPMAYAYTAASSGDSMTALAWGIVRSLGVNSALVCGKPVFANGSGFLSTSGVSSFPAGVALDNGGVLFSPLRFNNAGGYTPTYFSSSLAINAVVGSLHTFTMSVGGLFGWNRRVRLNSNTAGLAEIKFYRDAALTDLQYSTLSGGINPLSGNFNDRASWPFDTDSGTIYGTLSVFSTGVGSDTLNVIASWEV